MCFVCIFHVFSFCFTASWPNFKRFQYCFVEIFIINEIKQTTTNWIKLESARPYRKWCVSQRFSRVAYLAYHMIIGTLETIRNYVYLEVYKMAFKNCFEVKQRQDSAHLPLALMCYLYLCHIVQMLFPILYWVITTDELGKFQQ